MGVVQAARIVEEVVKATKSFATTARRLKVRHPVSVQRFSVDVLGALHCSVTDRVLPRLPYHAARANHGRHMRNRCLQGRSRRGKIPAHGILCLNPTHKPLPAVP